jgi:hypothetical protein
MQVNSNFDSIFATCSFPNLADPVVRLRLLDHLICEKVANKVFRPLQRTVDQRVTAAVIAVD